MVPQDSTSEIQLQTTTNIFAPNVVNDKQMQQKKYWRAQNKPKGETNNQSFTFQGSEKIPKKRIRKKHKENG